jgi:exopolysaccharide production protein ExoQ
MRISRTALANSFLITALVLSTNAFLPLLLPNADISGAFEGSPLTRVAWSVIYLITVLRLIPRRIEFRGLVSANKSLVFLTLFAVASVGWSLEPIFALHQSLSLVGTALLGCDLALHCSVRRQLWLIGSALAIVLGCSILADACFPTLIPFNDPDSTVHAWHGVFDAKNSLARLVVLAVVVFLCIRRPRRYVLVTSLIIVIGGVALVMQAHSAAALVILTVLLITFYLTSTLQWRPMPMRVAILLVAVGAGIACSEVLLHVEFATALLDRDSTLTGRSELWRLSVSAIEAKPVYGYGYDEFWIPASQQATRIREEVNWEAPHAHNGYIDLALYLGFIGLGAYLVSYVIALVRALQYIQRFRTAEAKWPLCFLVLIGLYQLPETTIVQGHLILWLVYVAISCSLALPSVRRSDPGVDSEPQANIEMRTAAVAGYR